MSEELSSEMSLLPSGRFDERFEYEVEEIPASVIAAKLHLVQVERKLGRTDTVIFCSLPFA
jgi:hypothetical protein